MLCVYKKTKIFFIYFPKEKVRKVQFGFQNKIIQIMLCVHSWCGWEQNIKYIDV